MMGSESIDVSLPALWRSWWTFAKGKRRSADLEYFRYHLEKELSRLHRDIARGIYRHGPYRMFVVNDTKRRSISVAPVRDRIVHRLLYDYLVGLYDKSFMFDVWSCRKGKGLTGAIDRVQRLMIKRRHGWFWRGDVQKFFDHVRHDLLYKLLQRRVHDPMALRLLREVITSFSSNGFYERERERERVAGRESAGSRLGT